jgi:glycosyltransferase involved in cell wall biosynthesis
MRRPLRIFVPSAATLLTDHRGHGEGLIAWNILCGLAARGHDVVACARRVDLKTPAPFEVVETGLASRRESLEPIAYALRVWRLYSRLGGERRFDVAHWIFPQGPHEVLGAPKRLPFVVGPHLLTWPTSATARKPGDLVRATLAPLFRALHRRALSRAAVLLVATPDAASIVPRAFSSKVRVLPFGIDASNLPPPSDPPPEPAIAFVGRLEPEKGVLKLVEAFARVREEMPEATLVVAGDGPERGPLEKQTARLDLGDSVKVLGPVPHARIPEVLRSSAIVCLPSEGEPYGMAVLEAMAAGRGIVTPAQGGPRFLLAHDRGEQLVARNDADSLAGSLKRLLADRDRLVEIGRENRERVESTFTLARMLDELEAFYFEAVERA